MTSRSAPVHAPKNGNTQDENEQIEKGQTPDGCDDQPNMTRQKDEDACSTKKHGNSHYGYKNHLDVDKEHKRIRRYAVTDASVHDSEMLDELLDEEDSDRSISADAAADRSEAREDQLREQIDKSWICRKGGSRRRLTKHCVGKAACRIELPGTVCRREGAVELQG